MQHLIDRDRLKLIRLNDQIELIETFLRLYVWALWQVAVWRKKYRDLEEGYNRLLHVSQAGLYRDGYKHLEALLEAEIKEYGTWGIDGLTEGNNDGQKH